MTKIALIIKGTLQIQWPHLQCYHFYELVVMTEGNSTVLLNKTVEATSTEKDLIFYEMENVQPCTAYTFFMRSGSETKMSVDQTAFVYFSKHADFIQLRAFADYHQVSKSKKNMDHPAMFGNYRLQFLFTNFT